MFFIRELTHIPNPVILRKLYLPSTLNKIKFILFLTAKLLAKSNILHIPAFRDVSNLHAYTFAFVDQHRSWWMINWRYFLRMHLVICTFFTIVFRDTDRFCEVSWKVEVLESISTVSGGSPPCVIVGVCRAVSTVMTGRRGAHARDGESPWEGHRMDLGRIRRWRWSWRV